MSSTRTALLIATDAYPDENFSLLRAPSYDADLLAEVLRDPEIGDYRVEVLLNQPSQDIRVRIDELFANASVNDLIVLYFSGHGFKDAEGRLHLATIDTRHQLSASTSVSAQFIRERIDSSRSRKVVVWLDCCYSGAFPAGMIPKAEATVDVLAQLRPESGRGCVVMTASTHIQYAYEPTDACQPSVFTSAIVEGLRTGDADQDGDGWIDTVELYDYVYRWVKERTPNQTPTHNGQLSGKIHVAYGKRSQQLYTGSSLSAGPVRAIPSANPPPAMPQLARHVAVAAEMLNPYPDPRPEPVPHRLWRYRPRSLRPAFWLWMVVTASCVVPLAIGLMNQDGVRDRARKSLQANHRPFTEEDVASVASLAAILTVVAIVVIGGLLITLTYRLRAGGALARNVLTVLGAGIIVLSLASINSVAGWELVVSIGRIMLIVVAAFYSFRRRAYAR